MRAELAVALMSTRFRLTMRHTMRTICTAFLFVLACAPAVAQVDPLSFVHIVPVTDGNAATDDRGFDDYINSTSFKIQSLVTVDKYQFIAYYDQGTSNANRNVTIARRDITNPTNVWTIDHTAFTSNDSTDAHDVISM